VKPFFLKANMHYYQHHIGDFIKDTSFLTNEEVGIYLKLIWLYYDTEQPLENDLFTLSMKTNARKNEVAVQGILNMYFELIDGKWHHTRCDKEITEYGEFCAKQKANGLKGGRPKATQEKPKENPTVIHDEPKQTLTTNHKPLTTNQINTPDGVSESVFKDYLEVRKTKKAKWSDTALKGLVKEAEKAGLSLQEAMELCCARGWVGFKADWVKDQQPANNDKQWMFTDAGVVAKASELGIHSIGLSYKELKDKCLLIMAKRAMQ
jgi:uncharacterized protein YdaU (DUF1376 family)